MGDIAEGAVMPITRDGYPKTHAAWGDDGIQRINALMWPAAEIVASSPGCDRLEILALSEVRSSPPDKIVFYADSANGKRFFITEDEVIAKRQTVSQNDKARWLDDQQLLEICREAVRARLTGPCSFSGGTVYRAVAGRTVVTLQYALLNQPSRPSESFAKCFFDGLSLKDVEFHER
ncbi:hypothetical protein C8245_21185 [Paracidovorax avenae]|uniref:hypothetical protein n=1 Tax=Paracidovorax avenae TaxID=80867 RepID=UPI000D228BBA|nr:hypothetical protein [Paracidovorax avenae]AVS67848.1 hypothetical protein C8245_21185 [Paracidovorax avenae]